MSIGRVHVGSLAKASKLFGDAVIDPAVWPRIMEEICAAVGATGAIMLQAEDRTPDIPRTTSVDEFVRAYFRDNFHVRDIRAVRGVPRILQGDPVVIEEDILTPGEIRREPYYNECVFPNGFGWFGVIGIRAGPSLWGLSIQRTLREGPFVQADKRVLETLSQPLTEVATLSTLVGRAVLSGVTNALAHIDQAAVVIDRRGIVLDANREAQALFDDTFYIRHKRLFANDQAADRRIKDLSDRVAMDSDPNAPVPEAFVVQRKENVPLLLKPVPIPAAARTPFLGARVILTLTPLEPKRGPGAGVLKNAFRLTPAEARLAEMLAQGLSLERSAERLNIARVTARNQLRAVFIKTGTHRQAELVALLARF
jgi:DNA-binding CsgD family transcriptional regulator